ncbi:MAG: heparinase II/III family protein [Kiritimatiellaeota bacterium]|nr:heparinase II/III family protein [Kiritimatiellota bacterium]
MSLLTPIAERIDRLEAARRIAPVNSRIFTDTDKGSLYYGDDAAWVAALDRNHLRFIEGPEEHPSFHFPDFTKIDFTGPELKHQEWREQLNRYYWARPLALEYLKTGDVKYARILRDTIEAWLAFHDAAYADSPEIWRRGDSTLSVSIRLGQSKFQGWIGCVPFLEASGVFDDAFVKRMVADVKDKLEYLLTHHAKAGNWRMSELNAAFFCGYALGLDDHVAYAVRNLNETFRNQFEADGCHCEHTPNYHGWMLGLFRDFTVLSRTMPELGIVADVPKLLRACAYCIHALTPDGRSTGLNDGPRWDAATPPQPIDAMRHDYDGLVRHFGLDPAEYALKPSGWFFDAGQFFLKHDATQFIYDNTNSGGWHCHAGRGGVYLYHGGRMLLSDPGSLDYEGRNPFMVWGRSTFLHNTVTLSGMSQAIEHDGRVRFHDETDTVVLLNTVYAGGYVNETSNRVGRHVRTFLWVKGRFALVLDTIDAGLYSYWGPHRKNSGALLAYESHWQFGDETVVFDEASLSAYTADTYHGRVFIKALYSSDPQTARLYQGSMAPVRGWIAASGDSSVGGQRPAPMLVFEGTGNCTSRIAQIIVPFDGDRVPHVSATGSVIDGALHLAIDLDGTAWRFAANTIVLDGGPEPTQIGDMGPLRSDAMIALACPAHDIAWHYNGTYIVI